MTHSVEYHGFPKITRLYSPVTITEKLDGTCGIVLVTDSEVIAGTKNRLLTESDIIDKKDNYGFGEWVNKYKHDLASILGVGYNFGEFWGKGIQRTYNEKIKVFTPFKFCQAIEDNGNPVLGHVQLRNLPILYEGKLNGNHFDMITRELKNDGSVASPGFMNPEGFVVHWKHNNMRLKFIIE